MCLVHVVENRWKMFTTTINAVIITLLFVFLISSILHHRPALLHRHTLILDRLWTFLVAFSTLILILLNFPFLKVFSAIAAYLFLMLISRNYDYSLFGSQWRR